MTDMVISDGVVVESEAAKTLMVSKSLCKTLTSLLSSSGGKLNDELAERYADLFQHHVHVAKLVSSQIGCDFTAALSLTGDVFATQIEFGGVSGFDSAAVHDHVNLVVGASHAVLDESFVFKSDATIESFVNTSFSRSAAVLIRAANKVVELHNVLPMGSDRDFALEFSLASIAGLAEEKSLSFSDDLNEEEQMLAFESLAETIVELYLSSWADIAVCLLNPSGHILSRGDITDRLGLFRDIVRDYPLGHSDRQDSVVSSVADFIYSYAHGDSRSRVGPITEGHALRLATPIAVESMLPLAQAAWDRVLTRIYQNVMSKDEQELRDWLKGEGSQKIELGVVFKEIELLYSSRPRVENEVVMDFHVVESEVRDRFNLASQAVFSVMEEIGPWGGRAGDSL